MGSICHSTTANNHYCALPLPLRRVKMPPPVSDRDLVQFTALKHDEDNKAWYTIYKNGEHASKPPQPGIVR